MQVHDQRTERVAQRGPGVDFGGDAGWVAVLYRFEVLWRLIVRCTDCAHRAHDCRARTVGCVLGFRVGIFEVRLSRTVIFDVRGFARQCWLRSDRNMRFALAGMTLRGGSHDGERFLLGNALAARGLPSSLLGSCHGGDL